MQTEILIEHMIAFNTSSHVRISSKKINKAQSNVYIYAYNQIQFIKCIPSSERDTQVLLLHVCKRN